MEVLCIQPTEITPKVIFDKGKGTFVLQGKCLPEDAKKFFSPIIEWFDLYLQQPNNQTDFLVDFDYFNTASSKMIIIILSKLRNLQSDGKQVKVIWKYPQSDMELEEAGEEFSELLNIPFEFVPKVE
ncbi:MAG: DUF1987 domain-containing protein [Bacteroidales bacterium]|nr:DUF1987 domain-containing protein [Tenuifilaceae bacterium]